MGKQVEQEEDENGGGGGRGGEDGEAVEAVAGVRCHGFGALAFLRLGRGKVAARRAAAARAGLGRLARSEAALMAAPQWGQVSGVCGVIGLVLLLAFGPGVDGDIFGGAENCFEFAEDHDDKPGRMALEKIGDGVAGNLF